MQEQESHFPFIRGSVILGLLLLSMSACQGGEQKQGSELEIARSAAQAFCAEFGFSSEEILELGGPLLDGPTLLERDKRQVITYRWLGGGRGDSYVQVEIYQDYQQVVVYGGYSHKEFGPWQFDPAYQDRSFDAGSADDDRWHLVKQGQFVAIAVEKILYEIEGYDHFFVHVRLRNVAAHTIGVDLHDAWAVFYPNQWTASQEAYRMVVDEMRRIPKTLTETRRENMLKDFGEGLTMIRPGQVIDYYREFNAGGRREIEQWTEENYLIVTMDGQLFATDGEQVQDTNCWNSNELNCFREVAIAYPVSWKPIPPSAFVMTD